MHPPIPSGTFASLAACLTLLTLVACTHSPSSSLKFSQKRGGYATIAPLPNRDESVSFHGPGSSKVAKSQFPPIRFSPDSYALPADAAPTLDSVAAHLRDSGASAILAGFTDPGEVNRILGERRALSVRQALIERGTNPDILQTVSYGHDFPQRSESPNRRVEFGIVQRGSSAANGDLPLTTSPQVSP